MEVPSKLHTNRERERAMATKNENCFKRDAVSEVLIIIIIEGFMIPPFMKKISMRVRPENSPFVYN